MFNKLSEELLQNYPIQDAELKMTIKLLIMTGVQYLEDFEPGNNDVLHLFMLFRSDRQTMEDTFMNKGNQNKGAKCLRTYGVVRNASEECMRKAMFIIQGFLYEKYGDNFNGTEVKEQRTQAKEPPVAKENKPRQSNKENKEQQAKKKTVDLPEKPEQVNVESQGHSQTTVSIGKSKENADNTAGPKVSQTGKDTINAALVQMITGNNPAPENKKSENKKTEPKPQKPVDTRDVKKAAKDILAEMLHKGGKDDDEPQKKQVKQSDENIRPVHNRQVNKTVPDNIPKTKELDQKESEAVSKTDNISPNISPAESENEKKDTTVINQMNDLFAAMMKKANLNDSSKPDDISDNSLNNPVPAEQTNDQHDLENVPKKKAQEASEFDKESRNIPTQDVQQQSVERVKKQTKDIFKNMGLFSS